MTTLVQSVAGLWMNRIPTHRAEIREAWEGDDPQFRTVDDITAIELEESPM